MCFDLPRANEDTTIIWMMITLCGVDENKRRQVEFEYQLDVNDCLSSLKEKRVNSSVICMAVQEFFLLYWCKLNLNRFI